MYYAVLRGMCMAAAEAVPEACVPAVLPGCWPAVQHGMALRLQLPHMRAGPPSCCLLAFTQLLLLFAGIAIVAVCGRPCVGAADAAAAALWTLCVGTAVAAVWPLRCGLCPVCVGTCRRHLRPVLKRALARCLHQAMRPLDQAPARA